MCPKLARAGVEGVRLGDCSSITVIVRGEQFIEVENGSVRGLQECIGNVLHEGRHFNAKVAKGAFKDGVGFACFQREVVLSIARVEVVGVGKVKGVKAYYRVKGVGRIEVDEVVFAAFGNGGRSD